MSLLYPPFQKRLFETIHVLRLLLRNIFAPRRYLGVTLRVHLRYTSGYTFGCYMRHTWIWEYRITWLSVVPYTRGTKRKEKKTTKLNFFLLTNIVNGSGLWVLLHTTTKGDKPPKRKEKSRATTEFPASAWVRTASSPVRT